MFTSPRDRDLRGSDLGVLKGVIGSLGLGVWLDAMTADPIESIHPTWSLPVANPEASVARSEERVEKMGVEANPSGY